MVKDLYKIFCNLFPEQSSEIDNYRANGKHGILMYTKNRLVYRFEYNGPNNYSLKKGYNKNEVI